MDADVSDTELRDFQPREQQFAEKHPAEKPAVDKQAAERSPIEPKSQTPAAPHFGSQSGLNSEPKAASHAGSPLSQFLLYTVSLPERVVRSTVGVAAGAARETAHMLVPQAFKNSKSYELVVTKSLGFLSEDIGGVESTGHKAAAADSGADQYLARKAVGNFVDLAGLATLHVSPIWVFAIVSDVAYGSKAYLRELATELHQQGLIGDSSTIDRVDDLLEAVRATSAETATLFDTPPLSVDQLKHTLERTRTAIASADYAAILPESELRAQWTEMRAIAARENVSLLGVSGALTMHMLGKVGAVTQGAIAGVQVAGGLLNRNVLGHYRDALRTVHERGFYPLIRESSAPYVKAVWKNFSADRQTWTTPLVTGEAFRTLWHKLRGKPADNSGGGNPADIAPAS